MRNAFPRPWWMSTPECPPFRPETFTRHAAPALAARRATLRRAIVFKPPEQPMHSVPVSSLSRFRKYLDLSSAAGKLRRARQPGLFVDGEDKLERPVSDVLALHHRERRRDADAVVRAERRSIGLQPISVAHDSDWIVVEVVSGPLVLLADHVQMALQQRHGCRLAPRMRRLAYDRVADLVVNGLEAKAPCS